MIYNNQLESRSRNGISAGDLDLRLVVAYLNGHQDLAALADEWLHRKNHRFVNKPIVEQLLAKAVSHLAKRPL